MEKAVLERVKKSISKKKNEQVIVEVLREDRDSYITRTIQSTCEGSFILKQQKNNNYYFCCDRSGKGRGASTGNPSRTRANSCNAYCHIRFEPHGLLEVSIVRVNAVHSGHELGNPEHAKRNRLHPDIRDLIHLYFTEGKSNTETLQAVYASSREQGHTDEADRTYYPTAKDVTYQRWVFKRSGGQVNEAVDETADDPVEPPQPSVQEMLKDLSSWASSENYESNSQVEELLLLAHQKLFGQECIAQNNDHNYLGEEIRQGLKRKHENELEVSIIEDVGEMFQVEGAEAAVWVVNNC